MATDGNCLYRAISKILCGKQKYHPQVRTFLADFVDGIVACSKPFQWFNQYSILQANQEKW